MRQVNGKSLLHAKWPVLTHFFCYCEGSSAALETEDAGTVDVPLYVAYESLSLEARRAVCTALTRCRRSADGGAQ